MYVQDYAVPEAREDSRTHLAAFDKAIAIARSR